MSPYIWQYAIILQQIIHLILLLIKFLISGNFFTPHSSNLGDFVILDEKCTPGIFIQKCLCWRLKSFMDYLHNTIVLFKHHINLVWLEHVFIIALILEINTTQWPTIKKIIFTQISIEKKIMLESFISIYVTTNLIIIQF